MAKSKHSELKKFLNEMKEAELREEILKLYNKIPMVKDYYNQEFMSREEHKIVLDGYKKKIYNEYWTRSGNPKVPKNNVAIKKMITEFERVAVFPYDVIDLLIYRVEIITDSASQFGGAPETNYNAAITSFKKALTMMHEHKFSSFFEDRCKEILRAKNLDYWYMEELRDLYEADSDFL